MAKVNPKPSISPGCAFILLLAVVIGIYILFFEKKNPSASEVVHNNELDASVSQVEEYLKSNLSDPDSYQEISWSVVVKLNDSKEEGFPKYQVRHKYRAKNGFGGYVVEEKIFRLDYLGNVVDSKDFLR